MRLLQKRHCLEHSKLKPLIPLYLLAVVIFFSLDFTTNFETPKSWILISLACFTAGTITWRDIRRDWIGLALILFCASAGISTYYSIDRHMSFWGNIKSNNGLLVTLSYAVLYFIAKREIKTKLNRMTVFYAVIAAAFIASVYAIIQVSGHDMITWDGTLEASGYTRPPSTIGQPILLSGYLVMAIPFALYIMEFHTGLSSIASSATLALALVSVLFTQSRGSWIALMAIGILYAKLTGGISRIIKFGAAAILCSIIMLAVNGAGFRETTFDRLHNVIDPGPARLEYPKAAIRVWKKYPLVGAGTDAFETAFQHQRTPYYWEIEKRGSPHRAHNEALNILATQGLLGIAALSFLTLSVFGSVRLPIKGHQIPIFISIVAFYLQNLSSFTTIATGSLFIVCIAMLGVENDFIS